MATTETAAPPVGEFREVRPNKMWPPQVQYLIRVYIAAKGETLPPCPACGKKRRGRWTMLCPFSSFGFTSFTVVKLKDHAPLELVCGDHPLQPAQAIMDAMGFPARSSEAFDAQAQGPG